MFHFQLNCYQSQGALAAHAAAAPISFPCTRFLYFWQNHHEMECLSRNVNGSVVTCAPSPYAVTLKSLSRLIWIVQEPASHTQERGGQDINVPQLVFGAKVPMLSGC